MSRLRAAAAALILSCSFGTAAADAAVPTWTPAGSTAFEHLDATAVALPGGSALVLGGLHWTGTAHDAQTFERYDRATNTWTTLGPLPEARRSSAAVVLRDGRVLVSGGWNYPQGHTASADLYSPGTDTWADAKPMTSARGAHDLVLLDDGKALAVGGTSVGLSELYDPAADTWTPSTGGESRREPAVAKLADGRVLAAGGSDLYDNLASADLYDPATRTWKAIAPMHVARTTASAAALPDGRVLVAGGYEPYTTDLQAATTYEIYDPVTDTWSAPAAMNRTHGNAAAMVRLSDGRLVITGGYMAESRPDGGPQRTAEIYDPATGRWTITPEAKVGRSQHVAVALDDDSVLLAGGVFVPNTAERLVFAKDGIIIDRPGGPTPAPDVLPAPTAQPKPGVAAVTVPKRLTASRTGVVSLRVRCTGETTCNQRLTLRVRGGRTLARKDVRVAAGKTKTFRLTLSRAERRRLAGKTIKATVVLGTTKHDTAVKMR